MSGAVRSNPRATQDGRGSCHSGFPSRVGHCGDRIPLPKVEMRFHKMPPTKDPWGWEECSRSKGIFTEGCPPH